MKTRALIRVCVVVIAGCAFTVPAATRAAQSSFTPSVAPEDTGCTPEQRRVALRIMQTNVLEAAPTEVASLERALASGGSLAGWRLSHGYVVLATAGAVAVDNLDAADPWPQLLLYAPSPSSTPAEWLDFDGPDDPYRLVGWGYVVPRKPGSLSPYRRCIAETEWLVHEAGWHLKDGGMHLTPAAATEPERPPGLAVHMWHPQVWDLHVWRGDDGVPTITFANPKAPRGGRELSDAAFFYVVNGRKQPPITTRR